MEIATEEELVGDEEAALLREWLSQRPSPAFFEEGLHLLSLILTAIPEEVERETPEDVVALSETVARASGGVFGLLFTVSSQERAALGKIEKVLQATQGPSWQKLLDRDGEDNHGITDNRYKGSSGESALFQRVQDFRNSGLLEYLPIAYGGTVESLDRIGGPGFHTEVTDPSEILQKFAKIRERIMVGMPMGMGMAKGGM